MRKAVVLIVYATLAASAQQWPYYGGDAGGTRYSALDQINRTNVRNLRIAWTYHTGDVSDGTTNFVRSAFETTPLMVDGVLYLTTPFSRVIALEAETGRELWSFDPHLPRDIPENLYINRGAAYWTNGKEQRIYLGTLDGRLFAIDARTGKPVDRFGTGGFVNLRIGAADKFPAKTYGMSSPPAIYKDLVICGSITPEGEPRGPSGDVRAFDTSTGKLVWTFHTVAQKGEFGNSTWAGESWKDRGSVNAWPPISVDVERGMVFLPLTSPAYDFYGGDRPGDGLFGDSLVTLEAATGKRLWHFQTVHHNLWDYDLPAQPNLVTVTRNGKSVPAVAQVTKTGFIFVFDRLTGKPLFDVVEKAVPASEVPGEVASKTQPVPVLPPPYARQSMTAAEITDVTPESHDFCEEIIRDAVLARIFTPIGLKRTGPFPGTNGGANWAARRMIRKRTHCT